MARGPVRLRFRGRLELGKQIVESWIEVGSKPWAFVRLENPTAEAFASVLPELRAKFRAKAREQAGFRRMRQSFTPEWHRPTQHQIGRW